MKKFSLVCLLLVLVLLLTACGGSAIEGVWKLKNVTVGGSGDQFVQALAAVSAEGGSLTLSFRGGAMTMAIDAQGKTESNSTGYKINGDKLELEGTALSFSVNGEALTLTDGTTEMEFTRN